MFQHDTRYDNAIRFSRFDREHPLNSATRSILLEDVEWTSAEHYMCCKIAGNSRLAKEVRQAETAEMAEKLIKPWYRLKVKGWKEKRRLYMTRALYIQVQMYAEVREFLLETGDTLIAENSQYDHYWGVGRDLRGENMFGHIWMDIRKKLREDQSDPDQQVPQDQGE